MSSIFPQSIVPSSRQIPPINVNSMPYSPPSNSNASSRSYSPYAPSPVGSFGSLSPPSGSPAQGYHAALAPSNGGTGGYGIPSYAASTSSSLAAGRLATPSAGYGSRPYGSSPSPGISQAMMGPPQGMNMNIGMAFPSGGSGSSRGLPQSSQYHPPQRSMGGAGAPVQAQPQVMKGTLRPGQEVKVEDNLVVVEKYLSEGGYAHVYLTHSARPIGLNKLQTHCLKRIAFDDSQTDMMADTKKEIEVMRTLSAPSSGGRAAGREGRRGDEIAEDGSRWIVEYLGSEMRRTEGKQGRGWEVFILMEFCGGGGILDLLNKRLRDRLKEREILDIFVDVCEAVAHMHSLPRPLLHRDLKIENILCHPRSTSSGASSSSITDYTFKLCDFGSTTYPADRPPRSKKEADELAYDLNRHTTLQYRSPEMVEPLLGLPVGLPADVWALGVLLYKLCYYTTPFEEHGPLAIVNAKYTFPAFPAYSPLMQHLIASMLMEQPIRRPSVFDVLLKVHEMRGTRANPKYENMEASRPVTSASSQASASAPSRPAVSTPAEAHAQMMATIQPQRRGRPTRGSEPPPTQIPAVAAALDAMRQKVAESPIPSDSSVGKAFDMQLTGEISSRRPDVPPPPIKTSTASFDMDFGDAFKPGQRSAEPAKPSQPDLLDSIGDPAMADSEAAQAFIPGGGTGARSKHAAASSGAIDGFGDSFGASPVNPSGQAKAPPSGDSRPLAGSMASGASTNFSAASPQEEASFEDRFPSIEALTSGEERDALRSTGGGADRQSSTASGAERSPLLPNGFGSRPQYQGMSSFRASLTGEETNGNDSHRASLAVDGRPLPRSNHVTGSAFMSESPTEERERPSFIRIGSTAIPVSDESQGDGTPIDGKRTLTSSSGKYGAIRLEDSPPPPLHRQPSVTARDLLTDDDALQVKAGYLTMVPQQNGKSATGRAPPPTANKPRHLSLSTGQNAPPVVQVDSPPSSAGVKPLLPSKPQALSRAQNDRRVGPGQSSDGGNDRGRSRTLENGNSSAVDSAEGNVSTTRGSPVSTSTSLPTLSPPNSSTTERYQPSDFTSSSSTTHERPPAGPVRRSSINDIVSRFERMASPPRSPEEGGPNSAAPALGRKESTKSVISRVAPPPQVGSKPSGLRQPPETNPGGQLDVSTELAREGSTRPISTGKPDPSPSPDTKNASNREPPIQKDSIKSRIAMWNQAGPPVVGTGSGPPAIKPKPSSLGTGRRL